MKKSFFQNSIWFWMLIMFLCIFPCVGLYFLVMSILARAPWYIIILFIVCTFAYSYFIIPIAYYHITFYDDRIYTKGEIWGNGDDRTQFKEQVFYKDIVSVRIICVNLNSRKKGLRGMSSLSGRTYFEFKLSNGKTKWFYILYFTKKQRAQMLEIISEKTGLNLSYDAIEKYDASLFGKEMRAQARKQREAKKAKKSQNKDKKQSKRKKSKSKKAVEQSTAFYILTKRRSFDKIFL